MATLLIAKVKSLSVTVKGQSALAIKGVRTAEVKGNKGLQEDYDPDDTVAFHWQGNQKKSVTFTMRDYQLALRLFTMPCITAFTCVVAAPKGGCSESDTLTSAATIAGTNLVATGDIEPVKAAANGIPTEYSVTFEISHVDGVAGTLTITPEGEEEE